MIDRTKITDKNYSTGFSGSKTRQAISFSASIALHAFAFFVAAFFLRNTIEKYESGDLFVQLQTVEKEEVNKYEKNENLLPDKALETKKFDEIDKEKKINDQPVSNYLSFTPENADTSQLEQIYKESTLNVSLKYPLGWKYIDQNVENELDGVTFWSVKGNYSPPLYVHLEVKEKYLFNPKRFKHSFKTSNYTAYYNDPEELSGQVSQTIYIRTDDNQDFSIKLIMEGMDNFKAFQPEFFGIVKSFKFGKSFF